MNNPYKFGSTLAADFQLYVKRPADTKLQAELTNDLCYVFNARKSGKSSLLMRVIQQLESNGDYICVYFEIPSVEDTLEDKNQAKENSELNKKIRDVQNLDMFFDTFLDIIIEQLQPELNLEFSTVGQWNQKFSDSNINGERRVERFFQHISQQFKDRAKVIVFIDEVDNVQSLPFNTDSFFKMIRGLCNDKTQPNIFNFCLVGVAKVSDLIKHSKITSFNLGTAIELTGFNLGENDEITEELKILITPELENKAENPNKVLKFVIKRTGGQPFLTQKFLSLIIDYVNQKITEDKEDKILKDLENKYIVQNWRVQDNPEHFQTIERRIINYIVEKGKTTNKLTETNKLTDEKETATRLNMYSQILTRQVIADNLLGDEEKEQMDYLILSGLIINDQGILKPYCPIYEEIFNLAWINECSNKIRSSGYQEKKTGWEKSNSDLSERDRACLLYGDELTEAEQKYKKLSSEDEAFINTSSKLYEQDVGGLRDPRLKNLNDYQKKKIIDRLRYWTNYDKEIFDYLIIIINDNYDNNLLVITENDRANNLDELVNNLVETKIIKCWHEISTLSRFDDQIKTQEENIFFSMLVVYGQILHQGKVSFSETDQHQEFLLKIGLVKKRYSIEDGYYIEVSNPILVHIFDKNYINEMLPDQRGYGKKLGMWLITQDAQYLLSVEELETIISTLAGESLPEEDHRFLIRSQISANSA